MSGYERIEIAPVEGTGRIPLLLQQSTFHDDALFVAPVDGIGVHVLPADLIAAVEKECDGIFIRRADLPKVKRHEGDTFANGANGRPVFLRPADEVEKLRADGLAILALAEHLDAHPPVDEADVETLAEVIADVSIGGARIGSGVKATTTATDLARALLASGRIEVRP